ncbi:PH domain-containing protein [Patescibacteria group bacterium]|nr:PH domain-containing protein [Patescibacteria group bacterium]MBU4452715.1 PH domain-containing protein [Patescibacteria group bacterium]
MISLRRLPNHERDESSVLFLRRHWIEVVKIILIMIVLLAIPVVFYVFLSDNGADWTAYWGQFGVLLFSVYSAFCIAILMTMFTDYYLDTWIVTTNRIINIEQRGLFSRVVSELHLNQIQDVTAETQGFLPTILSYGNVYIQTAGAKERFIFKMVNDPEIVKRKVTELVEQDKRRHGDASR